MKWIISFTLLLGLVAAILYAPILNNIVESDWRVATCSYHISQLEESESLKALQFAARGK